MDPMLLLASEARVHHHVLRTLVHAARGSLNHFNLTLALLATGVARGDLATLAPEVRARWVRQLEALRSETRRLAGRLEEIDAVATPRPSISEAIDVAALLRDVVRMLRHDATRRGIELTIDEREPAARVTGDPYLVRHALLSFTIAMLDAMPASGRVAWRIAPARTGEARARVAVTTSAETLPPALVAAVLRPGSRDPDDVMAIAARAIIEAQGGDVSLADGPAPGFLVRFSTDRRA